MIQQRKDEWFVISTDLFEPLNRIVVNSSFYIMCLLACHAFIAQPKKER